MKFKVEYIFSGLSAILFIQLTKMLAYALPYETMRTIVFSFHLVPFGIGFSGGSVWLIYGYYFVLWVLISLVFVGLYRLFKQIKRRP